MAPGKRSKHDVSRRAGRGRRGDDRRLLIVWQAVAARCSSRPLPRRPSRRTARRHSSRSGAVSRPMRRAASGSIARATSLCVGQVAALRATCLTGALRGGTCDAGRRCRRAVDAAAPAGARPRPAQPARPPSCRTSATSISATRSTDVVAPAASSTPPRCRPPSAPPWSAARSAASRIPPPPACRPARARRTRLLRFGMRTYAKVLDRIAALNLPVAEKERLIAWAERRIGQTRARSRAALTAACAEDDFSVAYGRSVDTYPRRHRRPGRLHAAVRLRAGRRRAARRRACGNGVQEPDEECDDGNDFDGDGCRTDCVATECDAFASTFDLDPAGGVREVRLHGVGAATAALSRAASICAPAPPTTTSSTSPSTIDPARKRIEPGDPQRSVLFLKLAAKTLPEQYPADELGIGSPMPNGPVPGLTQDELEAVRLWIYGAAPRTGTVKGVADLLHGCTPEPEPIRIKPLEPPPPARACSCTCRRGPSTRRASTRCASPPTTTSAPRCRPTMRGPTATPSATTSSSCARIRSAIT